MAKPLKITAPSPLNRLCLSCRRSCKQVAVVVIAECKRYHYTGLRAPRREWKQLELPLK